MDQNNGLKAMTSKGGIKITFFLDLQEIFPHLIRTTLHGQTSHMGITIRTMEDHMINARISPSIEAMDIDLEMDLSIIGMEPGGTMETSLVLHRLQGEIFHKRLHSANQGVINLKFLPSADPKIAPRVVSGRTNKTSHRTITRRHLMWFA